MGRCPGGFRTLAGPGRPKRRSQVSARNNRISPAVTASTARYARAGVAFTIIVCTSRNCQTGANASSWVTRPICVGASAEATPRPGAGARRPSGHITKLAASLITRDRTRHVARRPRRPAATAARRGVRLGAELLRLGPPGRRGRAPVELPQDPRRTRPVRGTLGLPHLGVRRDPPDRTGGAAPGAAGAVAAVRTPAVGAGGGRRSSRPGGRPRSEEHTSELQSLAYLVCRLLLEKKKNIYRSY